MDISEESYAQTSLMSTLARLSNNYDEGLCVKALQSVSVNGRAPRQGLAERRRKPFRLMFLGSGSAAARLLLRQDAAAPELSNTF